MHLFNSSHKIIAPLSANLDDNIKVVETLFGDSGDIVKKSFNLKRTSGDLHIFLVYIDGMSDNEMIERTVLRPLMYQWRREAEDRPFCAFFTEEIESVDIAEVTTMDDAIATVLKGDCTVFVDGSSKAIALSSKQLPVRGIGEPVSEQGTRGARDSFNENIRTGTALLRKRIKDPNLRVEQLQLGQRSRTECAICYVKGIAKEYLPARVKKEMQKYEIDGVFDSSMVMHLMEKKWYSPFSMCQTTERPDKVASALLEGRVVILIDNSPEALLVPATFFMFFQAADDYFNRWWVASFSRLLRFLAAFLAIGLSGFYVAVTCFHTEILPTELLLAISAARTTVTFPILVEVLLMELLFELLREAGIRLPGQMGNTIGVVGGLIVGQSAVEAHLVSTIVVIVVALSAIASFCIPNEAFSSTFRLVKFFLILLSAFWGFYGFVIGMLILAIHMAELDSFGVPFLYPAVGGEGINRDNLIRMPLVAMTKRPIFAAAGQKRRLKKNSGEPHGQEKG